MNYHKRIAIWAEPRTGSTYLVDLIIRYLEKIQCENIFIQKERIDTVINDFEKAYENKSCLCLRNHLEHFYLWEQHKIDNRVGEFYNIFLYRQNFFEQTVSNWIGNKTQVWATGDVAILSKLENNQYSIPQSEFIQLLELRWRELNDNFTKVNYDVVCSYEDLTFDYNNDICLLGLDLPDKIHNPVRTLKLPDKKQQVINWEELNSVYQEYTSSYYSDWFKFDTGLLKIK